MKSQSTRPLAWEDAAVSVTVTLPDGQTQSAWMSVKSRHVILESQYPENPRFPERYPDGPMRAEDVARYQDATHLPCACGGRRNKNWSSCEECRTKAAAERWHKQLAEKGVDYDRETPLVHDGDRFLWDLDEVADWLNEYLDPVNECDLSDVELYVAAPVTPKSFSLSEWLGSDVLPEDEHLWPDFTEIDQAVNSFLAKHSPLSWQGTSIPVRPESLRYLVEVDADAQRELCNA